jgi:hypothetical protein
MQAIGQSPAVTLQPLLYQTGARIPSQSPGRGRVTPLFAGQSTSSGLLDNDLLQRAMNVLVESPEMEAWHLGVDLRFQLSRFSMQRLTAAYPGSQ